MELLNAGNRSKVMKININNKFYIKKIFFGNEGKKCFENEKLAFEIFQDYPWMPNLCEIGDYYFVREYYPEETRLDKYVKKLNSKYEKRHLAGKLLEVLLDIYTEGYSHRDFHAKNIYIIDNKIKLVDFEVLTKLPNPKVLFTDSYDITGKGLVSPYKTNNMCYMNPSPYAIGNLLEVKLEEALEELRDILLLRLKESSSTFQKKDKRHKTKLGKIYSSFNLPNISVNPEEAQRDNEKRLKKFKIDEEKIKGKTVLDLGCNTGGLIFEIQKYMPKESIGIEYDLDKVRIANKIAAFSNLKNVKFYCKDIDKIADKQIRKFDVVFCLSVEAHVKDKNNLYHLLSKFTKEVLYFEANVGSDVDNIIQNLKNVGFNKIEDLGYCDDDKIYENNFRRLLIATR